MSEFVWLIGLLVVIGAVAYHRLSLAVASVTVGGYLVLLSLFGDFGLAAQLVLWLLFASIALIFNLPELRRALISDRLYALYGKLMPSVSRTEQEALDAGTVWWDAELFSGRPNWKTLLDYPKPRLSEEEQAFVDGPTEELCRRLDDWAITHELLDLPPDIWQFIKEQGFLGMIIPKEFGGKGYSALAHSEVVMKVATRSTTAAVTVMVPNSLGPAELLMQYGTDAQRAHYLPRLACGEDIPCFALTGPEVGSDAASMPDRGIVCKGQWEGAEVTGLRVSWEKRYITLAPVATLLGLAFKVYDPERLLGDEVERGITLALIPTDTAGVEIGRRHFPLNVPFQNGPTSGTDVFIPLHYVIGGEPMVGHGWKMLMNCLSVGRSISLPASAVGAGKLCSLTTGAYARVRQQFKLPIGEFEGVQEALARIGGNAYLMDAARRMTALAVDLGEKPSVLSGIVKYHLTERMRIVIDAAMDVHGGRGILLGPSNYLGRGYQGVPVSITVEGANILTRSLIIFGQGALRCHPFLLREMQAAQDADGDRGRRDFDLALCGHMGFWISNLARSLWLGLGDGRLSDAPASGPLRRHLQRLNRCAAAFALVADSALLLLGGSLKRKEFISGRLGDLLSYSYLASASLKHYRDQGGHSADLPLLEWAMADCYYRWQEAMTEVLRNFPSKPLGWLLRLLVFPLGRHYRPPGDRLTGRVARLLLKPGPSRERLAEGCYYSDAPDDPMGRVEYAFQQTVATQALEQRIHQALRQSRFTVEFDQDTLEMARAAGVIDDAELDALRSARAARRAAIMVDDFAGEELLGAAARSG